MLLLLLGSLLEAEALPPEPENGPSGGATWLRGYKPPYDYSPAAKKTDRRNELLIISAPF